METVAVKCQACGASLRGVNIICPYCGTLSVSKNEERQEYITGSVVKKDLSAAYNYIKNAIVAGARKKNGCKYNDTYN